MKPTIVHIQSYEEWYNLYDDAIEYDVAWKENGSHDWLLEKAVQYNRIVWECEGNYLVRYKIWC